MPSLFDRLKVMLFLAPSLFIIFIWVMALSNSPLLQTHGLTKLMLLAAGLSVISAYFIVLAVFTTVQLIDQKRSQ
ncbi:MAG: hypothetical protein ACAH10_04015 [Methylophilaceae bacterium]